MPPTGTRGAGLRARRQEGRRDRLRQGPRRQRIAFARVRVRTLATGDLGLTYAYIGFIALARIALTIFIKRRQ